MNRSLMTRWIVAMLVLATACFGLTHVPQTHGFTLLLWALALAFLITALILAVLRNRASDSADRRPHHQP